MSDNLVEELIKDSGGKLEELQYLPDGSGFAVASYPLPKDHWLTKSGVDEPPMPWKMGVSDASRNQYAEIIREAGKYAIRASTMNGKELDFDPDAMLQNLVVAFLGYWTPTGDSLL